MNKAFFLTVCLLAWTSMSASAERLYIVGVPSEMDASTGATVLNATLDLVLRANEGDRIQVFDALNLQKVFDVTLPPIQGNSNPKVRVVRLKEQIADLKTYVTRCASVRSGNSIQIKVPQFLELAGSALKSSSGDTIILLFGSPYYSDARDAAFVFGKGYYPSDGHILATSKRSVYGTSDKKDLLKGATVHFCHLKDLFETELERTAVRRFWKVYCDNLGTVLATFGPSRELVVERALSNVTDPTCQDHLNQKDTVIEMRKTVANLNYDSQSVDAKSSDNSRQDRSKSFSNQKLRADAPIVDPRVESALRSVPKPKPGSLVIAAVWVAEGNADTADVDLYVRPYPDAEELNFKHLSSTDGKYLRDIRAANNSLNDENWGASWEAVEINEASLDDATCWLNLYSGCGGKIEGVVRIVYDERKVNVPFVFPAIAGDKAAGRLMRGANPCWIEIRFDDLQWTQAR